MDAKFTPLPWKVSFGYGYDTEPDPDFPNWVEVTGGSFDDGNHFSMSGHAGIDKARAMAAAPDLYATCVEALAFAEHELEQRGEEDSMYDLPASRVIKTIRAALAKANGEAR